MYFPSEVSESKHACMLTHFVFARGVSSVVYLGALRLIYSSSVTLLGGALNHIFGLFYRNDMPSSPETTKSQNTSETVDVFERFKSYLDQKVENLTSGLVSQASSGTQKLERAAEAGKLKFQGIKDQFLRITGDSRRNCQFLGCAGRREGR